MIAARMASTRFPGKPMAKILGIPMVGHVYQRSLAASRLDGVWVATCDREIHDYIVRLGGRAVMTAHNHERATDRIAEAVIRIEKESGEEPDYVVLIQGDEPMLLPDMLHELIEPVTGEHLDAVNLVEPIESEEVFESADVVKVVLDRNGNILYFSRAAIPSRRKHDGPIPMLKQLGLILFARDVLIEYANLAPAPLEVIESVDMNRLLEHGRRIRAVVTRHVTYAVDRPGDIPIVEARLEADSFTASYLGRG